jgi:hypothetical protein
MSKRFCVYFTIAAWLIVSVALLFIGENSALAQTAAKPVKPYVFNKDVRCRQLLQQPRKLFPLR